MELEQYIVTIKNKISASPLITTSEVVDEKLLLNRGYFRVRLTLLNTDFVELTEAFTIKNNQLLTLDYRYQWMDSSKQVLRKRWDSVKHFPDLPNFPHHVHIGSETNVKPGQSRNILEFIDFMESELS
ncbi:hypothetical protein J0895_05735 [Phormidium pseudopriestleyi FRX01]|uniref:Uncharacterized protein n=1 Tax=Phormidium pseudopriestleyi FRX01 TaxID=1759528 RepID=A0ABS3FPQ9_9CYAN|nr:DUF6516 family protein [Phormidium pseudopriestleyi]MBO0348611.1 hypothetical protein [Phormidium pseudopriestleyi FRX01]